MTKADRLKVGVQPVYEFSHLECTYRIVRTDDYNWRRAFGFKPTQPYLLLDSSNGVVNGVTETDLHWYRQRGSEDQ